MPQSNTYTRRDAAEKIAAILKNEGFAGVTSDMIHAILEAWAAGLRGSDLPHGKIGMMAGAILALVDRGAPGGLASLKS